jgi:predicted AAA+ superfamily ATPase
MRPIAIGESDFRYMIEKGCLYVDKSLFIKDLIDDPSRVILITRPRRFGKTLNLSMLNYFFKKSDQNVKYLFENLLIWQEDLKYKQYYGQFPVIFITFKDLKFSDWNSTIENIIL